MALTRRELLVPAFAALSARSLAGPAQQAPPAATTEAAIAANPKLLERRYLSAAEVRARHEFERERGISFLKLVRGDPSRKTLALTFDDGPHPAFTPRLLEALRQLDVPATFFVVGKMVDRAPDLVRQEAWNGHEVANHTYSHVRLPTVPARLAEAELVRGADAIRRALGSTTRLYRPPGGEYDADVIAVTRRLGDVMVLWTDDPADFANPGAARIEARVLRKIANGGILLLHDGIQQTLDILPDLVTRLKAKGFRFVTCSQMALERGVITTGGPVIRPPKP
jgi:peptidoglycan-N-acetylglucosamine deacetylase